MKSLLCFLLLTTSAAIGWAQNDRYDYIDEFAYIAVSEMERTGIPASIKLAQGILESNAGKSELAVRGNNHFGIKCHRDWKGKKMYRKDDEPGKSCFRVYDSATESYLAHSAFLTDQRRYAFLFEYQKTDYKKWAKGLKKAGYATSPTYANKLISVVENYELHKYDRMRTSDFEQYADTGRDRDRDRINRDRERELERQRKQAERERERAERNTGFERRKTHFNDIRTVYAVAGETLVELARAADISVQTLQKYNPIYRSVNQPLVANDRVYLQPKRGKYRGKKRYHLVEPGETLEEISHEYGVKLKKLYSRNRLPRGVQVAAGQRVLLKGKVKKGNAPRIQRSGGSGADPVDEDPFLEDPVITPERPRPSPVDPQPPVPTPPPTHPVPVPPAPNPTSPPAGNNNETAKPALYHTVRPGETLYALSRRYSTTVDRIKQLNGLTSNTLSIGQQLRVQ